MVAENQSGQQFTDAERAAVRGAAFVDGLAVPLADERERLLGPRVVLLTPERLNLLVLHGSPISAGGLCSRQRLLQALWILSPSFRLDAPFRFALFRMRWLARSVSPVWRDQVKQALTYWHRIQFIDQPPRAASRHGAAADEADAPERWFAAFVLTCRHRLGFGEGEIRRMPYARLLQYLAEQDERAGGGRPRFNRRRDQQARAYLLRKQAKQRGAN